MFGPHTFVHPSNSTVPNATTTDAPTLLAHFHKDINMRFSGIRKPRTYSNQALSNSSGWLLPNSFDVGAGDNNWNMSAPGWADWYVANHLHFLRDGIDYWCKQTSLLKRSHEPSRTHARGTLTIAFRDRER